MAEYRERKSLFKRNNRMRWLYSKGVTHKELACLYDMSTRNVCRITAQAPPETDSEQSLKLLLPGLNALFGVEMVERVEGNVGNE
jgi:hypothetical protein